MLLNTGLIDLNPSNFCAELRRDFVLQPSELNFWDQASKWICWGAHSTSKKNSYCPWRYCKKPLVFDQNAEVNRVEELTDYKG